MTPTTAQIHLIRYGATTSTDVLDSGIRVVTAPVDFLKRHPHRRHAGHERHHPRARAPDHRVRAARRSRAVRDLGRPAVHRDGARVPRGDPRLGQEDRGRRQQDRHLRAARRSSSEVLAFVGDAARALLGVEAADLPGQRAAGARAPSTGEPRAVGGEPVRGAGALHPRRARRAEPLPARSCRARSASATCSPAATLEVADERLALLAERHGRARRHRAPAGAVSRRPRHAGSSCG